MRSRPSCYAGLFKRRAELRVLGLDGQVKLGSLAVKTAETANTGGEESAVRRKGFEAEETAHSE